MTAPIVEPTHAHTRRCCWDVAQARWTCRPAATPDDGRPGARPGRGSGRG